MGVPARFMLPINIHGPHFVHAVSLISEKCPRLARALARLAERVHSAFRRLRSIRSIDTIYRLSVTDIARRNDGRNSNARGEKRNILSKFA